MKKIPVFLAALLSICAAGMLNAANRTFGGGITNGDWDTAANWVNDAKPGAGDFVYISSGSSAILSNLETTIATISLGTYVASTSGTGSLTLDGATLHSTGVLIMGRVTTATVVGGKNSIFITNGSWLDFGTLTANIGYADITTLAFDQRESGEIVVDKTSSFSAGLFTVGRSTSGSFRLEGDATGGAKTALGRLLLGGTATASGYGEFLMGTNSTATVERFIGIGGANHATSGSTHTGSATLNGATLTTGTTPQATPEISLQIFTNSSLIATGSTISALQAFSATSAGTISLSTSTFSVKGNTTLSGSTAVFDNSKVTMTGHVVVGGQTTLGMTPETTTNVASVWELKNGSNMSVSGNMIASQSSAIISGSTLSTSGNLNGVGVLIYDTTTTPTVATGAVRANWTISGSTVTVGNHMLLSHSGTLISGSRIDVENNFSSTGDNTITTSTLSIVNSSLSIGGAMSFTDSNTVISNSSISIGGVFYARNTGKTISISGSTISASGITAHFATNILTFSGASVVSLQTSVAATADTSVFTAHMYLNGGSTMTMGANSLISVGQFIVGNAGSGSFTMNNGHTRLRNVYIGRNAADKEAGTGVVSIMGGRLITNSTSQPSAIHVGGVTGSGALNMGGTGRAFFGTLNMSANGTFSGALYVYSALSTIDDVQDGEAGFNTLNMEGGATFKGLAYIDVDTSISLNASGSVSTMRSVSFDDLTFGEGAELVIDFKNVVLSVAGGESLALITAVVLAGQADMIYTTKNLQAGYQVDYEWRNVSGLETLFADISLIPEPSACAGLLGLLALAAAVRRRR